jgi:sulfur carrier protein
MKVQLSHPERLVEVKGPKRVKELLRDLNLVVEAHLVIRGDDLVTEDEMLKDEDQVEVRPVISGGSQKVEKSKVITSSPQADFQT